MSGNNVIDIVLNILGVISGIASLIGLVAPKGSKVGYIAAKIGTDLKGQTKQAKKELAMLPQRSSKIPPRE